MPWGQFVGAKRRPHMSIGLHLAFVAWSVSESEGGVLLL